MLEPTLPLHLQKVLSATPGVIGLLFAVPTLAYGLPTPIIGTMSTRIGHMKAIITGLIMVAIALPLVALPNMLWVQVCALAFLGISMGMVLAPCLPQLADISQKSGINSYGITFALYNTAYSIGMMIGPIASSTIADAFGLTISYMTIAAIVLLYMIFLTTTSRSQ
ncbi:hypothetical protein C2W64_00388 [Brevibacillus laterosporus]|nr:MFS transporter [Brevibacillus laterosporus]RAP31216.1 hypothetical protein C2W64_00388 [Brevibacillus laterosporus]